MTNETFCENRHIYLGFSIFVLILLDFMEIFQDGTFTNFEYYLFQVIWCVSALINKVTLSNETFCGNRHIYLGLSIFGHI